MQHCEAGWTLPEGVHVCMYVKWVTLAGLRKGDAPLSEPWPEGRLPGGLLKGGVAIVLILPQHKGDAPPAAPRTRVSTAGQGQGKVGARSAEHESPVVKGDLTW